jgi:hypothetical protein
VSHVQHVPGPCFQGSAGVLEGRVFKNRAHPRIVVGQPTVPEAVQPVVSAAPAGCGTLEAMPPQILGRVGKALVSVNDVQHVADLRSIRPMQIIIYVSNGPVPGALLGSPRSQKPFSQLRQLHWLELPLLEPYRPRHSVVLEG